MLGAKPCHRHRLTKRGWMPDAVLNQAANRPEPGRPREHRHARSPNAGLFRFRCRGNRGVDVPPGDGGSLAEIGWAPLAPFRTTPVAPFGVPVIVSLCFWGGLYGAVFGLLMPRFTLPLWLCGLILGVIAALVGMFIVAPIKGNPIAGGWVPAIMLRSLAINGCWGFGVGLILPMLMPRALVRVHP